jgi:RNA-directed DNA polymerase
LAKLWRWAKRRHRNKPTHWIKQKYFGPPEAGTTLAIGQTIDPQGKTIKSASFMPPNLPSPPSQKNPANPYDPQWKPTLNNDWIPRP